jgi:ABC transporter substrate binding protein
MRRREFIALAGASVTWPLAAMAQEPGRLGIRAAQEATRTIPIIGFTDDMAGSGFVTSIARPNGNITGVNLLAAELNGKRQEILIEAVPGLRRMAALADTNNNTTRLRSFMHCKKPRARNVELSIHQIRGGEEIAAAIDAAKASGATALNVLSSPILYFGRRLIMDRVAAIRMPAIYQFPEQAEEGGFIGYGPNIIQISREITARLLAKVSAGHQGCRHPRWDAGDNEMFDKTLSPEEIMDKLEERVGPKGRKLFEQFLRKVNKLHAQQYLEAQAQRGVTERSGERGPV